MTYGIDSLVEDLRTARDQESDEQSMLAAAKLAVGKVMKDGSWIKPEYRIYDEELRYGDVLLHEDDDHRLQCLPSPGRPVRQPCLTTTQPGL